MGYERTKREYDLRAMNRVSESEYESRMVVWDNLALSAGTEGGAGGFVDTVFSKLQQNLKDANRELSIDYSEFVTMANEEVNYIRVNVADNKVQAFWYATILLMLCGSIVLCI
ncbi:thiamine-phosphate diphosphorylase [Vibrio sp. 99-70-13A1]|uniref:thiamine-phosphate diphosphorylase n=1 Tax=Vibrio sp. 99-70-13A1 TaxID=2607601 RepID=UPI001493D604|nr:thiamine-phosphate diphosphorylase [Vibrio sp. 99-70-13A1]NOH95868.1 thiamine-phosphate diphosphorylase [Vibrio sp. 99-70-13A1]